MAKALRKTDKPSPPKAQDGKLVVYQSDKKQSQLSHKEKISKNLLDSLHEHHGKDVDRSEMLNTLLKEGHLNEEDLAKAFAERYNIEHISNLSDYKISKEVLSLVPQKLCQKYTLIPLVQLDKTLVVVFSDPSNAHIKDNIALLTGCRVQPVVASRLSIQHALDKYYDNQSELHSLFYELDKVNGSVLV